MSTSMRIPKFPKKSDPPLKIIATPNISSTDGKTFYIKNVAFVSVYGPSGDRVTNEIEVPLPNGHNGKCAVVVFEECYFSSSMMVSINLGVVAVFRKCTFFEDTDVHTAGVVKFENCCIKKKLCVWSSFFACRNEQNSSVAIFKDCVYTLKRLKSQIATYGFNAVSFSRIESIHMQAYDSRYISVHDSGYVTGMAPLWLEITSRHSNSRTVKVSLDHVNLDCIKITGENCTVPLYMNIKNCSNIVRVHLASVCLLRYAFDPMSKVGFLFSDDESVARLNVIEKHDLSRSTLIHSGHLYSGFPAFPFKLYKKAHVCLKLGRFSIGWGKVIVELEVPADARIMHSEATLKTRVSKAHVVCFRDVVTREPVTIKKPFAVRSDYDRHFFYSLDEDAIPSGFDLSKDPCSKGIHGFLDIRLAEAYNI